MSNNPIIYTADMGLQNILGYVTHIYDDRTEIYLDVRDIHLNRAGLLHGGIFCTLLDSACGYAASRHLSKEVNQRVVTLTLNTNFLAPGRPGPIKAIGRVTGGGHKTIFTEGKVFDKNDKLLASATAIMRRITGETIKR